VPLGEDCGLIEFIPNLITLRQVIMNLYKGKGERNETREELSKFSMWMQLQIFYNAYFLGKNDSVEQKKKVFETALIPAHPPVLSDWFHWKFSDHSAWYIIFLPNYHFHLFITSLI
jgi:serine/threonine-protein kinase ATR